MTDALRQLLRDNRRSAGLSQAALAARMGTTQSVIARAESDRAPSPTVAFLERFVNATGRQLTATISPSHPVAPTMSEVRRQAPRLRASAAAHEILELRVVGSVALGSARPDSDVDLLVTTGPGLTGARYFAALDGFREACVRILRRPVDVIDQASVTDRALRSRLDADATAL